MTTHSEPGPLSSAPARSGPTTEAWRDLVSPTAPSVDREVRWLIDGALGDDDAMALACLRTLHDEFLPWLTRRSVVRAHRAGRDWAMIGRLLGRSRQAVRQRYASPVSVASMRPPRIDWNDPVTEVQDHLARTIADLRREQAAADAERTGELIPW